MFYVVCRNEEKMDKNMKRFFYFMLLFSLLALILILSIMVVKMKNKNREMESQYSSIFTNQSKEEMEKEKILSDKKEAVDLIKNFISVFFLTNDANCEENRKKIETMVSAELYQQVKDEDFGTSDYTVELVSAPVYELVEDRQVNRYHYCSIISLQYRSGTMDYGIHMQIWDFSCGYNDGRMRILAIEQQEYIE